MADNHDHRQGNGHTAHSHAGHPHDHSHPIHDEGEQSVTRSLVLAFWMNLLFSVVEFIGGILTNSTAIIADAFHDFMDSVSIGLAILLEKFSKKKRSARYSYGYKRFSMLSALGLSIFLLVGAMAMIFGAYRSFVEPKEVNSLGMLGLAVLGMVVNGFAFLKVKKGGESHAHHHSHGHNHNSQSIMLHLLEDVLGWAAVLVGAVIMYFTGWYWIDGALAIGIALFIGYNAWKNLSGIVEVMLQSIPKNVDMDKLTNDLTHLEGVTNVHDLHVWSLDGKYNVGTVHAVVRKEYAGSESERRNRIITLMKQHNIDHPTVQLESEGNDCGFEEC